MTCMISVLCPSTTQQANFFQSLLVQLFVGSLMSQVTGRDQAAGGTRWKRLGLEPKSVKRFPVNSNVNNDANTTRLILFLTPRFRCLGHKRNFSAPSHLSRCVCDSHPRVHTTPHFRCEGPGHVRPARALVNHFVNSKLFMCPIHKHPYFTNDAGLPPRHVHYSFYYARCKQS